MARLKKTFVDVSLQKPLVLHSEGTNDLAAGYKISPYSERYMLELWVVFRRTADQTFVILRKLKKLSAIEYSLQFPTLN